MFGSEKTPEQLKVQRDKQLLKAAKKGDTKTVAKLLDEGANIEATTSFWVNTPLIAAAWSDRLDTVKFLLQRGAKINAGNSIGYTALSVAVTSGNKELAEYLLQKGADIHTRDTSKRTVYEQAVKQHDTDMVALMDKYLALRAKKAAEAAEKLAVEKALLEKELADRRVAEKAEAEKKTTQDYANVVIFTQKVGDLTVEDAFNFVSFERMTFVRKEPGGPVESMTRQDFADIGNQRLLRKAFAEHVKRGGTTLESDVFPDTKHKIMRPPEAKP